MNWTDELAAVLKVARSASTDELPRFLGDLEIVRAVAWQRLATPTEKVQQPKEELLNVHQAARRLGVSTKFLYTNPFPFTRQVGRRVLFSATDLNAFIRRNGTKGRCDTPQRPG
jgi:hypothetical protein